MHFQNMMHFLLLSTLLSISALFRVLKANPVECLPYFSRNILETRESSDMMLPRLVDIGSVSPIIPMVSVRSVFDRDEDMLREMVDNLVEPAGTRELVEMYDYEDLNSDSSMRYVRQSKSMTPNDNLMKMVPRSLYDWDAFNRALSRIASDSTKSEMAITMFRERQRSLHPSSDIYKVLDQSVEMLQSRRPTVHLPFPLVRAINPDWLKVKIAKMSREPTMYYV